MVVFWSWEKMENWIDRFHGGGGSVAAAGGLEELPLLILSVPL